MGLLSTPERMGGNGSVGVQTVHAGMDANHRSRCIWVVHTSCTLSPRRPILFLADMAMMVTLLCVQGVIYEILKKQAKAA